jgi:thiol-disulfide isomerase/thioredoxin
MKSKLLTRIAIQGLSLCFFVFSHSTLSAQNTKKGIKKPTVETAESTYQIGGKISGSLPKDTVVLGQLLNGRINYIGNAAVNKKDSSFLFTGIVDKSLLTYIVLAERLYVPVVLTPGSTQQFTIQVSPQGIQYDVKGNGAENSLKIRNFIENHSRLQYNLSYIENLFNTGQVNMNQIKAMESDYRSIQKQLVEIENDMLSDTNNPLGAYFVFIAFINEPIKPQYDLLIKGLSTMPENEYLKEIQDKYNAVKSTMIGGEAPDIKLPSPSGDSLALSDFRGKVVLIDFWASWCGPCRKENPNNKRIYEKYADKGFEIYAVSLDRNKSDWVTTIEKDALPWIHVSDLAHWNCAPAKEYKVRAIPATFLLDREGKILARDLRGQELESFLDAYFR